MFLITENPTNLALSLPHGKNSYDPHDCILLSLIVLFMLALESRSLLVLLGGVPISGTMHNRWRINQQDNKNVWCIFISPLCKSKHQLLNLYRHLKRVKVEFLIVFHLLFGNNKVLKGRINDPKPDPQPQKLRAEQGSKVHFIPTFRYICYRTARS